MEPLAVHLVFRLQDDRVIAPSRTLRRRLARSLNQLCRAFPLLAWRVVDTHIHLLGLLSAAQLAELARRLRIAMAKLHPGLPLLLSRRIEVRNQWHLAEAFDYALRQDEHHGVGHDPHHDGSCLPDLLGLRAIGSPLPNRVREHLPRVDRAQLLRHLGMPDLQPVVALEHLAEAAAAALALDDLVGNGGAAARARAAAVHAASSTSVAAIAEALGLTPRAVRRLAGRPPRALDVGAVAQQMALRAAIAAPAGALAG